MENRGSRIAVKVALFSVSLLVLIGAAFYLISSENSRWGNRYERSEKEASKTVPQIAEYMSKRDYIAVYNYMYSKDIAFSYDSEYRDYYDAYRTTEYFKYVYDYLLSFKLRDGSLDDYMSYKVKSVTSYTYSIYQNTSEEKLSSEINREEVREYLRYLREDTGLFLKYYINLSDEQVESIPTLSESQLGVMIEEAVTNAWTK